MVTKPKCRVVEAYARLVSNATKRGRERELPKCALKSAYYIVLDQSWFRDVQKRCLNNKIGFLNTLEALIQLSRVSSGYVIARQTSRYAYKSVGFTAVLKPVSRRSKSMYVRACPLYKASSWVGSQRTKSLAISSGCRMQCPAIEVSFSWCWWRGEADRHKCLLFLALSFHNTLRTIPSRQAEG